MADQIQNYDFDDAKYGNTYDAVIFTLNDDAANSLTDAEIYMQLRKKPGQPVTAEFSTENDKIEILSEFSFSLKSQIIDVAADTYDYDILIVFADGTRGTYIGGHWTINPAITYKKL